MNKKLMTVQHDSKQWLEIAPPDDAQAVQREQGDSSLD